MARPVAEHPTPAELEVLKVLWQSGPSTVREVLDLLPPDRRRAYTSVMSLLGVMSDKGIVKRTARGRAYVYEAGQPQQRTLSAMVGDLLERAFSGSAEALVAHLFAQSRPSELELAEIDRLLARYKRRPERRGA
jgi:predicted transcriptional regulator